MEAIALVCFKQLGGDYLSVRHVILPWITDLQMVDSHGVPGRLRVRTSKTLPLQRCLVDLVWGIGNLELLDRPAV